MIPFMILKTMKMKKVKTLFLIFIILAFVVQCSSSSTGFYRRNIETTIRRSSEVEFVRFKNEGVGVGSVEDSTREVPTGPDPLHHNNNPFEP